MDLTAEQLSKMKGMFQMIDGYKDLSKENNSCISEAKKDFTEFMVPKPSGKMSAKDKDDYKESVKEVKSFIADSYRIHERERNATVDTTEDALLMSAKLRS